MTTTKERHDAIRDAFLQAIQSPNFKNEVTREAWVNAGLNELDDVRDDVNQLIENIVSSRQITL